jgi:CheY-like chemotaxis protein
MSGDRAALPADAPLILVVDDDFDIRDTLSVVLGDHGYAVVGAVDGTEAIAWLHTHEPPRLILLDWMMPRCDGAQFRAAQMADPLLAAIPVVLLTADGRVGALPAAQSATGFLAKPVRLERLLEVVRAICRG